MALRAGSALRWLATLVLGVALVHGVAWGRWAVSFATDPWARNHGLAVSGGLSGGRSLAPAGSDHRTASPLLAAAGRQYVHPDVAALLDEAFAAERENHARRAGVPGSSWRVAETGWRPGGWFPPHLTHQDGLSVDVVTPLTDGRIPTGLLSGFGYAVEFTPDGLVVGGEGTADLHRLARFFDAVCRSAPSHGLAVRQLIVWGPWHGVLRGKMRSTCRSALVDAALPHDDHVHLTLTRSDR